MKVLHVVDSLDLSSGGPSVSVPNLAASQAAQGVRVSLLSRSRSSGVEEILLVARETIPGFDLLDFQLIDFANESGSSFRTWREWKSKVDACVKSSSIVHLHGVWSFTLLYVAIICLAYRVPYVIAPRGMLDSWSLRQKRIKKKLLFYILWRHILKRCAFIHCLNENEFKEIQKLKLGARQSISGNGISLSFLASEINRPAAQIAYEEKLDIYKDRYILFLSRLHKKKRPDVLVRCMPFISSVLNDVKLVIAGPDEGELSELKKLILDLGVSSRVVIVGPVYGQAKYSLIKNASVFCLPSFQEGFSVTLLEVASCGVPLVVSEGCNFNDVAHDEAGVVVAHDGSIQDYSRALLKILENPLLASKMGANGRELVRNRYTWDRISAHMISLYKEAV